MEEKQIMSFRDEEGNKIDFEAIAKVYLEEKDKEYLLLSPVEGNTEEILIFRIDKVNDGEEYNIVEDDKEFLAVKKEYKKLIY